MRLARGVTATLHANLEQFQLSAERFFGVDYELADIAGAERVHGTDW